MIWQPTPQYGQTLSTSRSSRREPRPVAFSTIEAGISAPVGQAWTHSPQATQVELPIGSSWSNTGTALWPR